MKRLALLLGALAMLAAACSGSSTVVANVGGTDILAEEVEGLVRSDSGEILENEFLTYLSVAIQWEAVEQKALADFGLNPSDDDVQRMMEDLVDAFDPGATLEEYLEAANASETGIRKYARQLIIQNSVESELADNYPRPTDQDVADEIAAFPLNWTEVCSAHILVPTAEEAGAAVSRLEAGEDFAELAIEISIDPGSGPNGGDLGCGSLGQFVEPFGQGALAAEIGVPSPPVQSDFGFHIILVSSKTVTDEEFVFEYLDAEVRYGAVDAWFLMAIESANVTVDDGVGVWVIDPTPQVLSPS